MTACLASHFQAEVCPTHRQSEIWCVSWCWLNPTFCLLLLLQVDVEDIGKVYSLFVDVKRSTQFLIEYQEQYMFNEVPEADEDQPPLPAAEGMEVSG